MHRLLSWLKALTPFAWALIAFIGVGIVLTLWYIVLGAPVPPAMARFSGATSQPTTSLQVPSPLQQASVTPTGTPTAVLESTATPEPTATPTAVPTDTPTVTPTSTPTATPTPEVLARVLVQRANVRAGPSTDFDVLGQLGEGDTAVVLGQNEEQTWVHIRLADGREAWIFGGLVEINAPPEPTPTPTDTPLPSPTPWESELLTLALKTMLLGQQFNVTEVALSDERPSGGSRRLTLRLSIPGGAADEVTNAVLHLSRPLYEFVTSDAHPDVDLIAVEVVAETSGQVTTVEIAVPDLVAFAEADIDQAEFVSRWNR